MGPAVRISPQVEHEIETKIRGLDDEEARIDYLLDVQRMLQDNVYSKQATHMSDYVGAFGEDAVNGSGARPKKRPRTSKGGPADAVMASGPNVVMAMSLCGQAAAAPPDEFTCDKCGSECCMDYATSDMICTGCGVCTFVYGQSADNVTFDQHLHMNRAPVAAYLRGNHLNELLSQIQGRETKHIPEHVLSAVRNELRKMRVHDMDTVDFASVDEILHRLNLTSFYEHTVAITSLVTGREVSAMTPEMETDIQTMFVQLQRPWANFKPKSRTNFICYRYVLYQLCRLLNANEFLPRFRLLKSRQRLADLDSVWKKICHNLDWAYYPVA